MQTDSDPALPPDLERLIFIYAFQNRTRDATKLFLVAKRVRDWLAPVAFRVVIVHPSRYFPTKFTTISKFRVYGHYIQHLLLLLPSDVSSGLAPVLDECLSLCPNISNLALWGRRVPLRLESLQRLSNLTHLSMDTQPLIDIINRGLRNPAALLRPIVPLFSAISHLDVIGINFPVKEETIEMIGQQFPRLTHFAIFDWNIRNCEFQKVSEECRNLKTLVWWTSGRLAVNHERRPRIDDESVVAITTSRVSDWENEARGSGMGMWSFVDLVIADRKAERRRRALEF